MDGLPLVLNWSVSRLANFLSMIQIDLDLDLDLNLFIDHEVQ